ncbi:hypothetical protein C8A05DRAFT_33385 [Staphylotrichum tortipilum]|uniref:Sialidase n=1 Tax=Staphylotrichum tortipilum TaxID=2831512 RepID=A0AAN6RU60_9PEZI|nr:hypothetical protein C8A05DRAFT_33385 [Staphylotrichum longicolle]
MSTLAADVVAFDFTFPHCDPTSPPNFTFDPSLLEIPYNPGHARSSSHGSVYSFDSSPSESVSAPSTRRTTPARSPVRTHGPLLLPKIRTQDQAMIPSAVAPRPAKRARTSPGPVGPNKSVYRPSHTRSQTNPETISYSAALSFSSDDSNPAPLLCSPVSFAPEASAVPSRRASSCHLETAAAVDNFFTAYQMPAAYMPARASSSPTPQPQPQALPQPTLAQPEPFMYQQFVPRAAPALAAPAPITPAVVPTTNLYSYLTSPNPTPSLVRNLAFPLRDPHTKHFWWDVRQVRPWTGFTASSILSMPGAAACLSTPLSAALLPNPTTTTQRHPETEAALHAMYAAHYLPKLNNALALCSQRPLQLSTPPKTSTAAGLGMATDCMFVARPAGEAACAAAIFGGRPSARAVGLVKSFDRFNSGMRVEGNVRRVEYLKGLAHLHHAMREHGCRYGFILTEIELVVCRNGTEPTPNFGFLEVASIPLATKDTTSVVDPQEATLTACLALWGLCMLAGDAAMPGEAHWKAEIGAPADGTRRKAAPRDSWMPPPQLAEKREAKRARGWVLPECPVGRKEVGKRGVRYGGC